MFQIRDIIPTDLAEVYKFTTSLYRLFNNLSYEGLLNESEFVDIFKRGYLRGLLITTYEVTPAQNDQHAISQKSRSIGCMLYHPTVSTVRGKGIYLDQFFLLPEFRGRGLGKRMMTRLCQVGLANQCTHIKLICRKGYAVEKVYEKWGFVNRTMFCPGLHLFQTYGGSGRCKMLDKNKAFEGELTENVQSNPLLQLVVRLEMPSDVEYLKWTAMNVASVGSDGNLQKRVSPPTPQLFFIQDRMLGESEQSAGIVNATEQPLMCTFTEQIQVCSWMGPMVNFSNFMGNTSLLRPELLQSRVNYWLQMEPNLRGAYWEVPCGIDGKEESNTMLLKRFLKQLNVIDSTEQEGWNIYYLDEAGMRHLAELPSGD